MPKHARTTRYCCPRYSVRRRLRSHTLCCAARTPWCVLQRFLTGGLDAVPRYTARVESGGSQRRGRAELLRVIELDPHEIG